MAAKTAPPRSIKSADAHPGNGKGAPADGKSRTLARSQPDAHQRGREIQKFGEVVRMPIGLEPEDCKKSVDMLQQVLVDSMSLRDLYKKHHWQVAGHTFYQLHLLFDKHYEEQANLIDLIAERIQLLGGLAVAMAADVAEMTKIERPPRGREEPAVQISRLLEAHEQILTMSRDYADQADENGDDGTNDLLVSNVIRTNELQTWFVAQHVVEIPVTRGE